MILIAFVLALLVAVAFAAESTSRMIPYRAVTWDGRLLPPRQVVNRILLRRVTLIWSGVRHPFGHILNREITRSGMLEAKRWMRCFLVGLFAFCSGYVITWAATALWLLVFG